MASNAGITKSNKCYTNYSVHKTTARKLQRAGFSNDKNSSKTGHKSEQSLRDYAETDNIDHNNTSHTLSASEIQDFQQFRTSNYLSINSSGNSITNIFP